MYQGKNAICDQNFERRMKHAEMYPRTLARSRDVAPCTYHRYWPLTDELGGGHVSSNEEVKTAVHVGFQHQPQNFLSGRSQALVQR
jgi:hypothetical protein